MEKVEEEEEEVQVRTTLTRLESITRTVHRVCDVCVLLYRRRQGPTSRAVCALVLFG